MLSMDGTVSLVICGSLDILTRKDLEYIKPKIAHFALVPINAIYPAVKRAIEFVGSNHKQIGMPVEKADHNELVNFLGMGRISAHERKYIPPLE